MMYAISHYIKYMEYIYVNVYDPRENVIFEDNEVILYTKEIKNNIIIVENLLITHLRVCKFDTKRQHFWPIDYSDYEVKYVNCVQL